MIKNLLFDFGAVLLPIEPSRSEAAFASLGGMPSLAKQGPLFQDLETGKVEPSAFLESLQGHFFRKKIFKSDLAAAWNATCFCGVPEENIAVLKKLKSRGYRLFLLSNTNALHIEAIRKHSGLFAYSRFTACFEAIYYSHLVGLRKPDAAFFQRVLDDNQLPAGECLFVDDRSENVATAKEMGLETWHFQPGEDRIDALCKELPRLVVQA